MLNTLSLCARVNLNLHNLNSEGTEGNQQQTRMVHVLDQQNRKCVVNGISGDMFKHIYVEHLTPLLLEAKQTVCANSAACHPDRILLDPEFKQAAQDKKRTVEDVITLMIRGCSVTDIAGALYADRAAARRSPVEFGWVVGTPELTRTEQYFHVKYDPSRSSGTGAESVAGSQAIFHRPASSGAYALVCHIELDRIGVNDVSRRAVIKEPDRQQRMRAALQALAQTLAAPRGAQRSTQHPHITGAEGMITLSRNSMCAPTISPLNVDYREEIKRIVERLNRLASGSRSSGNGDPEPLECHEFDSISKALDLICGIIEDTRNGLATV